MVFLFRRKKHENEDANLPLSPMEAVARANEVWNYHAETPAELAAILLRPNFHLAHPFLYPEIAHGNIPRDEAQAHRELLSLAMRLSYIYRAPDLAQIVAGEACNWSLQSRAVDGWQQRMVVTREIRVREIQGRPQPRSGVFERPLRTAPPEPES